MFQFSYPVLDFGLIYLLFYVTFYDISVICVTYGKFCRYAGGLKKKVGSTVGLPRHRHFVGFFNVPAQAPTRHGPPIQRNRPISSVAFHDAHGGTEDLFSSYTPGSPRGHVLQKAVLLSVYMFEVLLTCTEYVVSMRKT